MPAQLKIPSIPPHDSVGVREKSGSQLQRRYYKHGKIVLETTYSDPTDQFGSILFLFSNTNFVDSVFVFVNGDDIDIYQFGKKQTIHEQLSYSSTFYRYTSFDKVKSQKTEEGMYYVSRTPLYNPYQAPKYKIGKWLFYTGGQLVKTIDYDRYEMDGQKIVFTDTLAPLNRMKAFTDSLLIATFGSFFYNKYIFFNLDKSSYGYTAEYMTPNQPEGYPLLYRPRKPVGVADLCYGIRVGDARFDVIMIRIDSYLRITGKKKFDNYLQQEFILCKGLDSTIKNAFRENAVAFKKIARKYKMRYPSAKCFLFMNWEPTAGLYGKLTFRMEEEYQYESSRKGWTSYLRRLIIDPVTGEVQQEKSTTGMTSDLD